MTVTVQVFTDGLDDLAADVDVELGGVDGIGLKAQGVLMEALLVRVEGHLHDLRLAWPERGLRDVGAKGV